MNSLTTSDNLFGGILNKKDSIKSKIDEELKTTKENC